VNSGKPFALICEDDARFIGYIPKCEMDICIPMDADIVFVNLRTSEGIHLSHSSPNLFCFYKSFDAINLLIKMTSKVPSIGTDGYIITKKGVSRLLGLIQKTKICMEIDWYLFLYSLTESERHSFFMKDMTSRFDLVNFCSEKLECYVLHPALVEQSSIGTTIGVGNPGSYICRNAMRGSNK
jgi:GR25 family glycosyltransferase involved in LPS biosynthesis